MNISLFGATKTVAHVPPREGAIFVAVLGGTEVDLSRVILPESLRISALAVLGGVKLIVPHGTEVTLQGGSLFGGREFKPQPEYVSDGRRTRLTLTSLAVLGGIEVVEADC